MNDAQIRRLVTENIELFSLCRKAMKRIIANGSDWPGDRSLILEWDRIQGQRWEHLNEPESSQNAD